MLELLQCPVYYIVAVLTSSKNYILVDSNYLLDVPLEEYFPRENKH